LKKEFTHLHVHTHYSLLDGLGKIDDLLKRAKEYGMSSLAITDHGTMYGVVEFYQKAKEAGIKPIIGCEFYLAPNGLENKNPRVDEERFHLILLAKNYQGYKNLMKLVTEAHLKGYYYKPRIDLKVLEKYAEGLIGCSGCVQGHVAQMIIGGKMKEAEEIALKYQKILGKGNYFLELQHLPQLEKQKIVNDGLKKISKKTGIPLVATADVHYVNEDDGMVQDILMCLQTGKKITDTNRLSMAEFKLHLRSPEEMYEFFKDTPEALENTQKIAQMCNVEIQFDEHQLPNYKVPEGFTPQTYLEKLCQKGLVERYGKKITKEHKVRLEYELGVIEKMGFAGYFLIVQDFVNWAKENGIIVGPGRGSAAGSIIAYLTKITNIDPIKYNLLFERFLNPDRISLPDIDLDFPDDRRDDVLNYVRDKFGHDHVAQIITFGTMAAKAAIRDAGRVLGFEYAYCDKLSKMVPDFTKLPDALENTAELTNEYKTNEDAKKILDAALRLEGVARHASVHACGVVITPEPVVEYTPLQYMTGKEDQGAVTQYNASSKSSYVEKIGLVKMDFLGLKNLTIIQNALKIIKKTTGDVIDIDTLKLEDKKTFELLQYGDTTGVFQLESSGMKRYLKKLKPTVFEDIIAMVALYRPGPMEWIPDFIAGKHGTKKVEYLHPKLKPILENTYGVAVYQEQVMQIARELAGFTPGEADVLRKAMGKKIHEMIQEQKKKFIEGCVKNKIDKNLAEKVFSFIEPFAGYGFNRSHAACYALIGYQTAYLKAHYPAQFMAALLNSDADNIDRIAIEIEEARQMGIEVLPPNINESFHEFAVIMNNLEEIEKIRKKAKSKTKPMPKIRFGLEAIKGVGKNIANEIIKERKKNGHFKDIIDLVERIRSRDLNKKSLEALAKSGALDDLIERNKLLENLEAILNYAKQHHKTVASGQTSLFGVASSNKDTQIEVKITLTTPEPANNRTRLSWEKHLLGLYVSDHPLRNYQDYFSANAIPIRNLHSGLIDKTIVIGGIITKVQKIYTRKNKLMMFNTIEDGIGKMEILVFPKTLEKNPEIWEEEKIVLIKGKLSDKDGEYKLLCEDVNLVDNEELKKFEKKGEKTGFALGKFNNGFNQNSPEAIKEPPKNIFIKVDKKNSAQTLGSFSEMLKKIETGESKVFLTTQGRSGKLEIPQKIKFHSKLEEELENIFGVGAVEIK
jgi:DNA polymerase-3 subunit alpha